MSNILKRLFFSLFILFFPWMLWAQQRNTKGLKSDKRHAVATEMVDNGSHFGAIDHLVELLEKHPDNKKYRHKLAEAYYKSRDYTSAEKHFKILYEAEKEKRKGVQVTSATFYYALTLKHLGKYEEAREIFQTFSTSNYKEQKSQSLKLWAKQEVKSCEFAIPRKVSDADIEIKHMGDGINSAYSEFAPVLKDDQTLIFSSLQSDSVLTVAHGERHFHHVKLYESEFDGASWGTPNEIKELSITYGHSANGTFSRDKKRFYFTQCKNKPNNKVLCQIYRADVVKGEFKNITKLNSNVNLKKHTSTQPAIGIQTKGKSITEALYFVSDRKGGMGGLDIWYSVLDKEGNPGPAANCGKGINTVLDEITPHYDHDAGVLYFSSNFWPGYGGFDVFKSKGWGNKWSKPENIKMPINSGYDDTYFTMLPENKLQGFVVSNRPGGTSLLSETCCDDIWSTEMKIPTLLYVTIKDSISSEIMKDVNIVIQSGKMGESLDTLYSAEATIDFDTLSASTDAHFLKVVKAKENLPEYFVIGGNKKTLITVDKPGYNFVKASLNTNSIGLPADFKNEVGYATADFNENIAKVTLYLSKGNRNSEYLAKKQNEEKKDTVRIASSLKQEYEKTQQNIDPNVTEVADDTTAATKKNKIVESIDFIINLTFEYKQIELNQKNQSTLDSLVQIMQKNKRLSVGFTTHTDGIGSSSYNLDLSNKRAAYIAAYLVRSGLPKERIKMAKGLGESKPLLPEKNPDGSDNPDARRINRRTEIHFYLD